MQLRKLTNLSNLQRAAAVLLLLSLFASACTPGTTQSEPTANPTLLAVAQMLTQTSAAPTATATPTVTPVPTQAPAADTPEPAAVVLPAAQPVSAGPVELTVLAVQRVDKIDKAVPAEGQAFIDVEVRIRNTSGAGISYTPSHFLLLNAQQQSFQPLAQPVEPQLRSGTLLPGEYVRGHITFAASGSEPYTLHYNSGSAEALIDLSSAPSAAATENPAAADNPGPSTQTAGLGRPGNRIQAAGVALEINQIQVHEQLNGAKPRAGWVYIDMLASIYNIERDNMPYNPGYFRLRDMQGYEYGPAGVLPEDSLNAGTLKKSQRVDGRILFEVPAQFVQPGAEFVLSYLPMVLFEEYQYEEIRVVITPRK